MNAAERRSITFCMEWMPSYRRRFYEELRPKLDAVGVDMTVIHGLPPASRSQRKDHSEPDWGVLVPNRVATVAGFELTWQPVWSRAKHADLIIAQQEAANLFNYYAMLRRRFGGPAFALWGHGENPDPARANRHTERLKQKTAPYADWFFAYTERSADILRRTGFPADRITVTNNARAHDNELYRADDASDEIRTLCSDVEARAQHVGWMSSALDDSKRLPFLIDTLDAIHAQLPSFEFFVLGRGPEEHVVFDAADSRPWLHAVGARFGADKVAIGEIADVMIHPGLLGLHVVDGFGFGTPIITTEYISHSHEFDYLIDGVNSLVLPETVSAADLAAATTRLLNDSTRRSTLAKGCETSAATYSLDAMTDRFCDGVQRALASISTTGALK